MKHYLRYENKVNESKVLSYSHVKKGGSGEASRRINREFAAMYWRSEMK